MGAVLIYDCAVVVLIVGLIAFGTLLFVSAINTFVGVFKR
jgi:hypothetical protein